MSQLLPTTVPNAGSFTAKNRIAGCRARRDFHINDTHIFEMKNVQRMQLTAECENLTSFISQLTSIVGGKNVLSGDESTRRYRTGFRFGFGRAIAVVRPGTLMEQWRVVKACVEANKIVIMQAANTGLTGGSTPDGNDYDRDIVIISTLRMNRLRVVEKGKQVICFPGATLDSLERVLKPLGREPHSVIGSSCIGASVFGGVCNNSGGALVQRGPAYTEMAVYAQLDAKRQLRLVNHLGIRLGASPEEILGRLDRDDFTDADLDRATGKGHDHDYVNHVRDIKADTPARFNADPARLYEAAGCAGKLILFAVRLDTFPAQDNTRVLYIGTNRTEELTAIRHHILSNVQTLPISGEYMHRDAFDIADKYGKDTFLMIRWLGTARLSRMFALKSWFDNLFGSMRFLPRHLTDRVMQGLSELFPDHIPSRMREWRNRYEHHLLLKVADNQVEETRVYLDDLFKVATGGYFECTSEEGEKAFLHRFATAGAAVRYRAVHNGKVEDIVAMDVALRRNDLRWFETLPPALEDQIAIKLYYGHFLCHVFHQDYIVKKGHDVVELEHAMWSILDSRGAEYPAEHNVGHLYNATPELRTFYRSIDPCNQFNPGIGRTSKLANWKDLVVEERDMEG